jgi:putative ABC transport system permease protein
MQNASVTSAQGYLVVGLASIIIGETIFGKRSFKNWIISVALGAIVYYIIINVAIRLGLPGELMSILYASLIVVALCLPLITGFIKKKLKNAKID